MTCSKCDVPLTLANSWFDAVRGWLHRDCFPKPGFVPRRFDPDEERDWEI